MGAEPQGGKRVLVSAEMLDGWTNDIVRRAGDNLERAGVVARCLYGVRPGGLLRFVESADASEPYLESGEDVFVVPAPMSGYAPWIGTLFAAHGVVAAVEVGEYWTFPPDAAADVQAYLAGTGGPPSQHPRRMEGVMVSAFWPAAYSRVLTRRIVRRGGRAYLTPWTGPAATDALAGTWTGWLKDLLVASGATAGAN